MHLEGASIGIVGELDAGTVLTIIGDAKIPGLSEVECNGVRYAFFADDLHYYATELESPDAMSADQA